MKPQAIDTTLLDLANTAVPFQAYDADCASPTVASGIIFRLDASRSGADAGLAHFGGRQSYLAGLHHWPPARTARRSPTRQRVERPNFLGFGSSPRATRAQIVETPASNSTATERTPRCALSGSVSNSARMPGTTVAVAVFLAMPLCSAFILIRGFLHRSNPGCLESSTCERPHVRAHHCL